jgi:tRNA(adenine34) deaminase
MPFDPIPWMKIALEQAQSAGQKGEVPVGAVLVKDGQMVAAAANQVEALPDASGHAEILAIREASLKLGRWRLDDTQLVVTLEPCPMCITAIILARIPEVYFGTFDPRMGACGSLFDLSDHKALPHQTKVFSGVLEKECSALLKDFFRELRK